MIFNLKIKAAKQLKSFNNGSALVKYFVEDNDLKKNVFSFLDKSSVKLNQLQVQNFVEGEAKEVRSYNSESNPDLIILNKVKIDKKFNSDYFRNSCAGIIQSLAKEKISNLIIELPKFEKFEDHFQSDEYFFQTFSEGLLLGNYDFEIYKSKKKKSSALNITIISDDLDKLRKSIKTSELLLDAVYFARDLSNEPAITLTPAELAKRTKSELTKVGVKVNLFNKTELKKRKMTAVLAVGESSANPPYFIHMHYKPKQKPNKKIALVGKGVTFDSGGYSIKPSDGMIKMNGDMSGAATVIGIIKAAALLKLPVEIIGAVPAVENMITGSAYKPGDIVRTSSGKTIEVLNTDAEGRIVMADALEFVQKYKPNEIFDFATLTGACAVALGQFTAGLFSHFDELAERLMQSGHQTYERVWRLPLWYDFNSMIESKRADINNIGKRYGGAISAAKFLEYFVDENIKWAHIDIAGPALKHELNNYTEKYNTGFGVRLIIDYLMKS